MSFFTWRCVFVAGVFSSIVLMAIALYMQHSLGLEPCPLCVFQRMAVMVFGAVCLVGAIHNPAGVFGRRLYGALHALIHLPYNADTLVRTIKALQQSP